MSILETIKLLFYYFYKFVSLNGCELKESDFKIDNLNEFSTLIPSEIVILFSLLSFLCFLNSILLVNILS